MDFRSQEKAVGIQNSFGFNYAAANHEPSPAKQRNLAAMAEEIRREEDVGLTPPADHQQQNHSQNNFQVGSHHHPLPNHHHQSVQQSTHRSRKDPEPHDLIIPNSFPMSVTNRSKSQPDRQDTSPSNAISATATNAAAVVEYRECQKNHAAHLGGHVVDGCCEFMPGGEEGTREFLKCAACDCHRNFHRKESDKDPPPLATTVNCCTPHHPSNPKYTNMISTAHPVAPILQLPPQPPVYHHNHHQGVPFTSVPMGSVHYHPRMMAFGGGGPAESSSEDLNIYRANSRPQPTETNGVSRKRFRTKFSQEQKDKMVQFAEKLGWRIQKQDVVEVQQFCDEAGVKKQVFKVWMHNNKQAMKRRHS